MLHIKFAEIHENVLRYLPVGGLLGCIFLFEILLVVENDLIPVLSPPHFLETMNEPFYGLLSSEGFKEVTPSWFQVPLFSFLEILSYKWQGFLHHIQDHQYVQDLEGLNTFPMETMNWFSISEGISHFQHYHHFQYIQWPSQIVHMTTIEGLGQLLYTYYFYFFLLASLILLIAMIGAIVLTMHKGIDVKRQEVYEQNTREFAKTIRKFRDQ